MIKEVKEGMMTMSPQIENINKEKLFFKKGTKRKLKIRVNK